MRKSLGIVLACVVCFGLGAAAQRYFDMHRLALRPAERAATTNEPAPIAFDKEPLWAYGFDKPPAPGEKASPQAAPNRNLRPSEDAGEQTRPRKLQGSAKVYSLVDVRDGQNVIDWFPADHPSMPNVVAHGPAALGKTTRGCGSCHLPNGKGRPENAGIAGLPIAYFMRQIDDFRNGRRHTADPRKPNTNTMIELAKSLDENELRDAAEYFSSLAWTSWIRVVETGVVPKTRIVGNLFLPLEKQNSEAIAGRIIEVPEDEEQSEAYRNPHSGFVAYVPPGSLSKGKDLVTTGGAHRVGNQFVSGKTTPCITCHGPDLMGVADVPPIAGHSPSYMVRQMWDMQQGTRPTAPPQLMKVVVANLTSDDMVAIAAYVASLKPKP